MQYTHIPIGIKYLGILPNKNVTEKDDEDRFNDYQEKMLLKELVDAKLKALRTEAESMYPYR
jgi:hypothetical protein